MLSFLKNTLPLFVFMKIRKIVPQNNFEYNIYKQTRYMFNVYVCFMCMFVLSCHVVDIIYIKHCDGSV